MTRLFLGRLRRWAYPNRLPELIHPRSLNGSILGMLKIAFTANKKRHADHRKVCLYGCEIPQASLRLVSYFQDQFI